MALRGGRVGAEVAGRGSGLGRLGAEPAHRGGPRVDGDVEGLGLVVARGPLPRKHRRRRGRQVDGQGTSHVVGDVHPDVAEVAGWLTPNPGGVGPMTRAMLLMNVVEAAERVAGS